MNSGSPGNPERDVLRRLDGDRGWEHRSSDDFGLPVNGGEVNVHAQRIRAGGARGHVGRETQSRGRGQPRGQQVGITGVLLEILNHGLSARGDGKQAAAEHAKISECLLRSS